MWDRHWRSCFLQTKPPNQTSLLTPHNQNDAVWSIAAAARVLMSWLNRRRLRYLLLILCSPFLIPLFFVTFPFICAVEIFLFVGRRRRKAADGRCDERSGSGDEGGLLQRYLEDQLVLVLGSVYDCGDGDENEEDGLGVDVEYVDSARPLLQ